MKRVKCFSFSNPSSSSTSSSFRQWNVFNLMMMIMVWWVCNDITKVEKEERERAMRLRHNVDCHLLVIKERRLLFLPPLGILLPNGNDVRSSFIPRMTLVGFQDSFVLLLPNPLVCVDSCSLSLPTLKNHSLPTLLSNNHQSKEDDDDNDVRIDANAQFYHLLSTRSINRHLPSVFLSLPIFRLSETVTLMKR